MKRKFQIPKKGTPKGNIHRMQDVAPVILNWSPIYKTLVDYQLEIITVPYFYEGKGWKDLEFDLILN